MIILVKRDQTLVRTDALPLSRNGVDKACISRTDTYGHDSGGNPELTAVQWVGG